MTLQEQIIDAAIELLNQPRITGKIRQFGIETDHKLSQREISTLIIPDGTKLYKTNGINSFKPKPAGKWVIYLLSIEDLDLLIAHNKAMIGV